MLLAQAGYDYLLSGYRWTNPGHITYSIAPDGVFWNHGTNNLNATLNAKLGAGVWQRQFALALATWQSVANINIAQVPDSALSFGSPGQRQSDPRFGDIRIGGYNFLSGNQTTLAQTYFPPPQGMTEAGDLEVNTNMNFTPGGGAGGYDFFSVVLHETGHSLGLEHPTNPESIMAPRYQGVLAGLREGDIAGIQAIYGPRTRDTYQAQGRGLDWGSAIDVTAGLGAAQQTAVGNVSLTKIGDTEYFSVVAPNVPGARLQVVAAANQMSLLSPKVSLYDASKTLIATASDPTAWSNSVALDTTQIVPGRLYYIAVTGATSDAFAVGAYQLQVAFAGAGGGGGGGTPGNVAGPPQMILPGPSNPAPAVPLAPDRYESNNTFAQASWLGLVSKTVAVGNLTLDSAGDVDNFSIRNRKAGVYRVVAGGAMIRIFDSAGRQLAAAAGEVAIRVFRPRTSLYVQISAPSENASTAYSLTVAAQNARGKGVQAGRVRLAHRAVSHWPVQPRGRLH